MKVFVLAPEDPGGQSVSNQGAWDISSYGERMPGQLFFAKQSP